MECIDVTYFPFRLPETGLLSRVAITWASSRASSSHHDLSKHKLKCFPIPSMFMQSTGRMISWSGLKKTSPHHSPVTLLPRQAILKTFSYFASYFFMNYFQIDSRWVLK